MSAPRLRVLQVLSELRPSGAEVALRDAARLWSARGVAMDVLATGQVPGPFAPSLEAAGYRVRHLPLEPFGPFARGFTRLLARERYDLVHLHPERATFALVVLCRIGGQRRLVRNVHNVFAFAGPLRWERTVQRALARALGVHHVAVSPSVAAAERRTFRNPTTTIVNTYDDGRFIPALPADRARARARFGAAEADFVVATVGNCSPAKNHAALVEALALVARERPVRYLHAGVEEPGRPERTLAAARGLGDRVAFLGFTDDVPAVLAAADCYVMPSRWEGLGNAALEALGSGVVSVLADVDGLRDLRPAFPSAWWTAPQQEPLAAALRDVADLPADRRAAIGAALAATARAEFGLERGVRAYEALYETVLGRRWAGSGARA